MASSSVAGARWVSGGAVLGGHDHQVIIGDHIREVGIPRMQLEHHRIAALGADAGDIAEHGLGGRGGVLAQMVIDRGHHVVGGEAFAVVEGHALAQVEGPDSRIRGRFETFGQFGNRGAVHGNFSQRVVHRREADKGERVDPRAGITGVGGTTARQAQAQHAAGLGRGVLGKGREREPHGKCRRHRTGHGAVFEEVPSVHRLSHFVVVFTHGLAPLKVNRHRHVSARSGSRHCV